MKNIPMIGFSAYSGTGKTTLIEKLIVCLKAKGLRLAVVKHDAHDFDIDHRGKDSWRFTQAGADMMLISSATKMAIVESRPRSFEENMSMIHDVDLILIEGYKQAMIPRIGLCRKATGKGLPGEPGDYIALATDDEAFYGAGVPCFSLDDVEGIAEFMLQYIQR